MHKINLLGPTRSKTSRDRNRRTEERRHQSRRTINYAFGSEKWIEVVQATYSFWPKEDRRGQDRRDTTRRKVERRTRLRAHRYTGFRHQVQRQQFQKQTLTEEEKQMLDELIRH
jgi:hypothetical protein